MEGQGGREGGREGGRGREGDGESEPIWKVISSLWAVYLFINERKAFFPKSKPRPRREQNKTEWKEKKRIELE